MILSLAIVTCIMFYTKLQIKTRHRDTQYWNSVKWKDTEVRPKWKLWLVILNYFICLIPIFNIVWSVLFIIWYFCQLNGPSYDAGTKLTTNRVVFSNRFTKWLTKEV
jgi:hypothetical protein